MRGGGPLRAMAATRVSGGQGVVCWLLWKACFGSEAPSEAACRGPKGQRGGEQNQGQAPWRTIMCE